MSINFFNTNSFKIILYNANGLKQNEPELLHLLIQNKIDVALIQKPSTLPILTIFSPAT